MSVIVHVMQLNENIYFRWSPLLYKVHQAFIHIDTALCNQNVVKAESFKYVYVCTLHALFLLTTHKCKFIQQSVTVGPQHFSFSENGLDIQGSLLAFVYKPRL